MFIRRIVPAIQNFVKQTSFRNATAKMGSEQPKKEIDLLDRRQLSILSKNKFVEIKNPSNIIETAIRKSSGSGEQQIGSNIPGLRYMMGSGFRCTLVFTLFFLPAWWAPVGLFCLIWAKQMGWN
ncbi:hypothetical protein WA026_020454 [Henosepilachna vigintioctopunctata]|uniref:Uncharacterized protein n=1 Tax=Henosepilachna vigintioctopunctata TaxID=420089 RepID=A0AAW1V455_9CUCU